MSDVKRTRIAIDAMGGDFAPFSIVAGAVLAQKIYGDNTELILVGDETRIRQELKNLNASDHPIRIVHSSQVIGMGDEPAESVRNKQDSSIVAALNLQKNGQCDAFISAGNTGACMAGSLIILGRLPAVNRPAIASFFPSERGATLVLDVGANSDCKALNLYQFGLMGAIYFSQIFSNQNPRVGLLSIGEEKSKGNEVTIASHKLLSAAGLNFAGNIEGRDILKGKADVVICDGFVGNALLKYAEGLAEVLTDLLEQYLEPDSEHRTRRWRRWISKPVLREFIERMDYQEHGGALMLGVLGTVVVLRDLEGLSYNEISGITDLPLGTVMSRIARARERLRRGLAKTMQKDA